jgi:hypothetical protein
VVGCDCLGDVVAVYEEEPDPRALPVTSCLDRDRREVPNSRIDSGPCQVGEKRAPHGIWVITGTLAEQLDMRIDRINRLVGRFCAGACEHDR